MRLLLLTLALMAAVCGCAAHPTSTAQDLNGNPVQVFGHGAKATVLIFTRTDCPVSNRYAPEVNRLYAAYHPRGVEFLLVYVDPAEAPAAIQEHLRAYAYEPGAVRDPDHALVSLAGATITPEAAVFDDQQHLTYLGRINDLYVDLANPRSRATTRDLADAIDATLAGRAVAQPRVPAVGCIIADLKR